MSNDTHHSLTEMVRGNTAQLQRVRCGVAYFDLSVEGSVYSFPVPLEDIDNGTLERDHSAVGLMRWIRAARTDGTLVRRDA